MFKKVMSQINRLKSAAAVVAGIVSGVVIGNFITIKNDEPIR